MATMPVCIWPVYFTYLHFISFYCIFTVCERVSPAFACYNEIKHWLIAWLITKMYAPNGSPRYPTLLSMRAWMIVM